MKYKATIPFIPDMGSISPLIVSNYYGKTIRGDTLWHINSMRDHDGLPHLDKLPRGVKFERIK